MVLADYTNLVFNGKGNSADGWTGATSPPLAYSSASFWPSGSNSVFAIVFNDKDSYFGNQFPIVAGDQYYVAMDTYPLGGGASTYSFSIGMAFTDVNGNITTTVSGATRLAGTSGFQSIAGNVTVPTGYAYGVVWVQINGPASTTYVANGQVHYATNIQVRRMNGANLIVDGSISATKMVAQTITAAQISATAGITAGQIDARGLSIKDGSGNIILSAGVPLDFNNVGGTTKPANNATNDLVLVARGNCVLSGNTITKVGGAIAWDSDTYSKDSYTGGAYASVVPAGPFSTQAAMFGLNSDPTTDQSWTSLDYAFYTYVSGQLLIYESGVTTAYSGTWALGDVLVIAYDGVNVRYLKNGTVVRTVAAPSNLILFFDTSFSNPNSSYSNVRFGPLTSISTVTASAAAAATTATWSGVTGTGRPSDNATSDISLIARGLAVVSGNTISKTSGSGSWDSDVYSLDSYVGGAYASGVVLTAAMSAMFGLNTDPLTDSSYFSIDYAIYTANDGGLYAYESGTGYNLSVPYVVGDVLAVTYDGVSVNYLQNGVVRRTVAAPAGLKLYFDSSINSAVNAFKNVRFGPLTSISTVTAAAAAAATTANWTGVSGTPGNLASLSGTEAIANADAATSLGFNPSFSAWTGTFPVGWSAWSSTPVKTTAYNLPGMQYGVQWTVTSADYSANGAGMYAMWTNASAPISAGAVLTGSFSVRMLTVVGGGGPGYLIRLYTNSGITTYVDNPITCPYPTQTGWQKVPFTATANGSPIYAIQIYQMAGWGGLSGGMAAVGTSVVFGPMQFSIDLPIGPSQAQSGLINTSINIDGSGLIQGIGSGAGTAVANSLLTSSINDKISKSANSILSATVSINSVSGAGFVAGNLTWDSAGNRTGGYGTAMTPGGLIGYNSSGVATFSVNSSTGNAYFGGTLASGIASRGAASSSLSSSTTITGSASNISSGFINGFTYTVGSGDLLLVCNITVTLNIGSNVANSVVLNLYADGSSLLTSSSNPPPLVVLPLTNVRIGGASYNWTSANNFDLSLLIPAGTLSPGAHTFAVVAQANYFLSGGGGTSVTGNFLGVTGQMKIREFLA